MAGSAISELWTRKLFEYEFPEWFITHSGAEYRFHFDRILRDLHTGAFFMTVSGPIVSERDVSQKDHRAVGRYLLKKLAAFLVAADLGGNAPRLNTESLERSLEHDGYGVDARKVTLVVREGPVSVDEEQTELERILTGSGLPDVNVIRKHLQDANDHYLDKDGAKDHSSLGESRNFLQAVVDSVCNQIDHSELSSVGLPGGTGNRMDYLKTNGLLMADERDAFGAAWGFLSAGTHPGLTPREQARMGLVLSLEFGQALILKWQHWNANHP